MPIYRETLEGEVVYPAPDSYEAWLDKVDRFVQAVAGVSYHDLPDWSSRAAFDDGMTPRAAAAEALAWAETF